MKMLRFSLLTLPGTLVAGWFTISCTPGADTPAATSACRIQQSVSTSKSRLSTTSNQTDYTYDSEGKLVKSVYTSDSRPTSTSFVGTGSTIITYTYDANGYLTGKNSQQQARTVGPTGPTDWQFTTVSSYSYTDGRLTRKSETSTNPPNAFPTPTISTYEYDTEGNLIRIRANQQGNETNQSIAVYEKNQLVDYIVKSATGELHPYTIQNGLVPKLVIPGSETTLTLLTQYDAQQRQTLNEEYKNEQISQRIEQTWTDAKPATASLPAFKGIPVLRPADPFVGQEGVLATRKVAYWNSVSKALQPYNAQTSVVQTNAQGFVTSVNTTVTYAYSADQNSTVVTTYTYAGCQ